MAKNESKKNRKKRARKKSSKVSKASAKNGSVSKQAKAKSKSIAKNKKFVSRKIVIKRGKSVSSRKRVVVKKTVREKRGRGQQKFQLFFNHRQSYNSQVESFRNTVLSQIRYMTDTFKSSNIDGKKEHFRPINFGFHVEIKFSELKKTTFFPIEYPSFEMLITYENVIKTILNYLENLPDEVEAAKEGGESEKVPARYDVPDGTFRLYSIVIFFRYPFE